MEERVQSVEEKPEKYHTRPSENYGKLFGRRSFAEEHMPPARGYGMFTK